MRMAVVGGEKTFPDQKENNPWNYLRLGEWESDETEKCYREDFLKDNKFGSKKSGIWDENNEVCSMCQEWPDLGDGFRFHLPKDIFTAPAASLNAEKKLGDSDFEEKEKNYCEDEKEEGNEEDPVEGENQVGL